MASKNKFISTLTKIGAVASVIVAVVRLITLFQKDAKIDKDTEIDKDNKNKFTSNIPKIAAAAVVLATIVRLIKLFKDETEAKSEQTTPPTSLAGA